MTGEATISLFEEEKRKGPMDNKEDEREFKVLEDLRGFVFTWEDIKALNTGEHEKFWEATKVKKIKVLAGKVVSFTGNVRKERIVNKKRLIDMGLNVNETYYHFIKGWKNPKLVKESQDRKDREAFKYKEIAAYADSIDKRVEEALKKKERRRRKKIDYELDDDRGWTRVKPGEHKEAQRKRRTGVKKPSTVDKATWEQEDAEKTV